MQNDPVLVEKVARAIHDAGFPAAARDTAWEDVVWRDCATGQARAALSVIDNEMLASTPASHPLGKDQIQSEASRHVEPPEWQPIETAPKDGTDVLVTGSLYAKLSRSRPPVVAAQKLDEWGPGWFTYDSIDTPVRIFPTHWMPLPPAPGIEAEGQDPKELGAEHESPKGAQNPSEGGEK